MIRNKILFLCIISLVYILIGCESVFQVDKLLLPEEFNVVLNKRDQLPFNEETDLEPTKEESRPSQSHSDKVEDPIENNPTENKSEESNGNNSSSNSTDNSSPPQPDTAFFVESIEQEIIDLVNVTRESLGINPLIKSTELTETARAKSKDMYEYHYFDHQGHLTFSQLLEQIQLVVHISGENIYRSQSPLTSAQVVFEAWKESPNHYANMINDQFQKIGVGVYVVDEDGIRTYYVTQHLTD